MEMLDLLLKLGQSKLIEFEYVTRSETASAAIPIEQVDGDHLVAAAEAGLHFELVDDGKLQLVLKNRRLEIILMPNLDELPQLPGA